MFQREKILVENYFIPIDRITQLNINKEYERFLLNDLNGPCIHHILSCDLHFLWSCLNDKIYGTLPQTKFLLHKINKPPKRAKNEMNALLPDMESRCVSHFEYRLSACLSLVVM